MLWLPGFIQERLEIRRLQRENAALRREKTLLLEEMRIKDVAYARWEAEQGEMQFWLLTDRSPLTSDTALEHPAAQELAG